MYASMKDICTIMKVEKTKQKNLTHGAWSPQDGQDHQNNNTNKHESDYYSNHLPSWFKVFHLKEK